MKLTIPLETFLTAEKASVRLHNTLIGHLRRDWDKAAADLHAPHPFALTLSQFIEQWPLARLKKEVFGFGSKTQRELFEILERHVSCKTGRRYAKYVATLKPKLKSGWIACADCLPPIGENVQVFVVPSAHFPHGRVKALTRLIRYEEDPGYYWDNHYGGSNTHTQNAVTHWQPLAQPPKL